MNQDLVACILLGQIQGVGVVTVVAGLPVCLYRLEVGIWERAEDGQLEVEQCHTNLVWVVCTLLQAHALTSKIYKINI